MILDTIIEQRRIRLEAEKKALPLDVIRRVVENSLGDTSDFKAALKQEEISIIAEIKKASPSKGLIKRDFDPPAIAREYEQGGAAAISVLTEEDFFLGSNEYLTQVKELVSISVLRKDFIFDPWQVWQSAYLGADAILLISAVLSAEELRSLRTLANDLNMDALVEVHDSEEIKKALESEADIIGINNRDLKTFEVRLETTEKLIHELPSGVATVSESGIDTAKDMEYLKDLGVHAVLVGESLMRAPSISGKLKELKGGGYGQG